MSDVSKGISCYKIAVIFPSNFNLLFKSFSIDRNHNKCSRSDILDHNIIIQWHKKSNIEITIIRGSPIGTKPI